MRLVLSVCLVLAVAQTTPAQGNVPAPPAPAKYRVTVRYRILSLRDQHVVEYDALVESLRRIGFEFDPPLEDLPETDREDRTVNQLTGLIASKNALKLLNIPRIASVLLVPSDFALPDDPDAPVYVRLELAGGLPMDRQLELSEQVRRLLDFLDFRQAYGADHHGYSKKPFTRIVGTVPAGQLNLLVRDLRLYPTDWFEPRMLQDELPSPIRGVNPIRVVEVLPGAGPLINVAAKTRRGSINLDKIDPELLALTQQKDRQEDIVRIQIIVAGDASREDKSLIISLLQGAPTLVFDGWLGPVVTATIQVDQILTLAEIPRVSALRPVRFADVHVDPTIHVAGDNRRALNMSGLTELHRRGFRGQAVRLAVIDTDFRGWEKLRDAGKLSKKTTFVDLVATDNELSSITDKIRLPRDTPIGHGTQCALAAQLAAPEAEIVLMRIEAADPYQMVEAVEFFRGQYLSEALKRRGDLLSVLRRNLRAQREELLRQRRVILKNFADEKELELNFGFLGPVMGWLLSDRQLMYQQLAYQEKLENELYQAMDEYLKDVNKYVKLQTPPANAPGKGVTLITCALNWPDRYPMGTASTLSRWFDDQDRKRMLWFQAAGNTRGQSWTGFFRDDNKNGILEFADAKTPFKPGRWSHEVNFLAWQPWEAGQLADLPAGARVRVSLQWREPHDPAYYLTEGKEDEYLMPLADMSIQVLRQRDPQHKTLPADVFDRVARSRRLPVRLTHQKTYSIYEQNVEFTVNKPGRFAVQIERPLPQRWILRTDNPEGRPTFVLQRDLVSTGLKPLKAATLPLIEPTWEAKVRLFVDVIDPRTRPLGRVVLMDHYTEEGAMGVPADSRGVITVGAATHEAKSFAASALGPPAFLDLAGDQPDLWAFADLNVVPEGSASAYGTSLAAPFAAGWAATVLSACPSREQLLDTLHRLEGKLIALPQR